MDPNLIELHAAQLEQDVLRRLSGPIQEQVATLRALSRLLEQRAGSWEHIHEMAKES